MQWHRWPCWLWPWDARWNSKKHKWIQQPGFHFCWPRVGQPPHRQATKNATGGVAAAHRMVGTFKWRGFRRVRRMVMVNPLMFLGFPIFVVKCRTQPSPSGICLLISSESFKCLHIISLMCNIILLPSLGSAVSMWWLADDQNFYSHTDDCNCLPDFLAFCFLAFIFWLRSLSSFANLSIQVSYPSFQILVPPFSMLLDDVGWLSWLSSSKWRKLLTLAWWATLIFYVETKQLRCCVVRGRARCLVEFGCAVFLGVNFKLTNPLYSNQNAIIGWTPCDGNAQLLWEKIQSGKMLDASSCDRKIGDADVMCHCVITYNHHNSLKDSLLQWDLSKNGHRGTPCNTEWCKKDHEIRCVAATLVCLGEYMQLAKPHRFQVANWVQIGLKDRIRGIAFGMNTQIISEQVV